MPLPKDVRVVQAGVNTAVGNGQIPNSPVKVPSVKMPIQPRNKPWVPDWHPAHPLNQGT